MRKYYSDYVKHCTRFYFKTEAMPSPINSKVDYNNYVSVSNVLDKYDKSTISMLRTIYAYEIFPKGVDEYSAKNGIDRDTIWNIIQKYEQDVARERGLL